jgi:hypothetical protein
MRFGVTREPLRVILKQVQDDEKVLCIMPWRSVSFFIVILNLFQDNKPQHYTPLKHVQHDEVQQNAKNNPH